MSTSSGPRGGAAAGRENRAALIAAAREVFEELGIDAPLSTVAKRAGVGQGSLYRHFPDRVDLAVAVFEENIEDIERVASRPDVTLREVVDLVTHQAAGASALIELIAVARADARVAPIEARMRAVVTAMWDRAHPGGAAGAATASDVMLAISMVATTVAHAPAGEQHAVAERAWALLAPGLGRGVLD